MRSMAKPTTKRTDAPEMTHDDDVTRLAAIMLAVERSPDDAAVRELDLALRTAPPSLFLAACDLLDRFKREQRPH